MIDWNEVDKSSTGAWVALAERLIIKTQSLLTSAAPDAPALRGAQSDLGEFVSAANLQCPVSAITAVKRTNEQLTNALEAIGVTNLESRNVRFDAIKARMSSAANELRAEAALLRLEPARKALSVATEAVAKIKALATEVKDLRKDEIPAKIVGLAAQVEEIVVLLGKAAGG